MIDCRNSKLDIKTQIMKSRGVEDVDGFLHPSMSNLCDAHEFEFIDKGCSIVKNAIENGKSILIYADVDTDGIMSATIMYRYLGRFSDKVSLTINGTKEHGIREPFSTNADLIIVVDSINDKADKYIELLNQGKEIIVLDHHVPNQEVLDIKSEICLISSAVNYPNKDLSGAGVCWKFCKYLDKTFGTDYADYLIDLAAVGLVGDVCSMKSMENRAICYKAFKGGVKEFALQLILQDKEFNSDSISFSISPFINSAIRLGCNRAILNMFTSDFIEDKRWHYNRLSNLKDQQREIVESFVNSVDETSQKNNSTYIFYNDTFEGFNGLLASNLADKFNKPVLVGKVEDNEFHGSMRCPYNIDFRWLLNHSGLAECNGHEKSAGVSFAMADIDKLIRFLNNSIKEEDKRVVEEADILIDDYQLTDKLVRDIEEIDFVSGEEFKPISVKIEKLKDFVIYWLKDIHLKLGKDGKEFIKWRAKDDVNITEKDSVDIIGTPSFDYFRGKKKIQFIIKDLKHSENNGIAMIF